MSFKTACFFFVSEVKQIGIEIFNGDILGCGLQMTICYTQLMIIVGLCLDDGKSFTSRFFNTKVMQFLGRISMSLYLFHLPLIFYISGIFIYANGQENLELKDIGNINPVWTIPIHFILSLIFGTLLTFYVEDPARKWLTKWRDGRMKQGAEFVTKA